MNNTYLDNLEVTLDLIYWCEGMNGTEFRPSERNHAGSTVQLHRTTAERNHRMHKAEILVLKVVDIAEHLRLGVMCVKHRVRQELRSAAQALRYRE